MDPNACLKELRRLLDQCDLDGNLPEHEANRVVDQFRALDNWISNGGFLPKDWAHRDIHECDELCEHEDE